MRHQTKKVILILSLASFFMAFQNCGGTSFEANELASKHSSDVMGLEAPSSKARAGDRLYIASVFAEIFLPKGAAQTRAEALKVAGGAAGHLIEYITSNYNSRQDKSLSDLIINKVLRRGDEFQGNCTFNENDPTCARRGDVGGRFNQAGQLTMALGSATKEGYRISVCNEMVAKDRAVSNVMFNVTNKRNSPFEPQHIQQVYNLFYPGQTLSSETRQTLTNLAHSIDQRESGSDLLIWRGVTLAICYSTGWQIP